MTALTPIPGLACRPAPPAGAAAGGSGGAAADDAPFRALPEALRTVDEVVLAESLDEGPDHLNVRILRTAGARLESGAELTLPHPRLATPAGFVRFAPGSLYVVLLFRGVDGVWRISQSAEGAVFPLREDRVLVPAFYAPGATLPAVGAPLPVPVDDFFRLAEACAEEGDGGEGGEEDGEAAGECRRRFEELAAAARRGGG